MRQVLLVSLALFALVCVGCSSMQDAYVAQLEWMEHENRVVRTIVELMSPGDVKTKLLADVAKMGEALGKRVTAVETAVKLKDGISHSVEGVVSTVKGALSKDLGAAVSGLKNVVEALAGKAPASDPAMGRRLANLENGVSYLRENVAKEDGTPNWTTLLLGLLALIEGGGLLQRKKLTESEDRKKARDITIAVKNGGPSPPAG